MSRFIINPVIWQSLGAIFSGGIIPLAFAPFDLPAVAIFSIAVLFYLWCQAKPKKAFILGYLYGLAMFGFGVSWLHISINLFGGVNFAGAIAITFALVAYLALYPAITGYFVRKYCSSCATGIFLLLAAPAFWVFGEWCRSWIFTGLPWLNLAYSQTNSVLSAFSPLTGIYGVSWLVCLIAALFLYILLTTQIRKKIYAASTILIIYGACFLLNGIQWTRADAGVKQVALIQGAVPQEIKWQEDHRQTTIDLYLALSKPHWQGDLIIWPETAIPMFYHQAKPLLEKLLDMVDQNHATFLTGIPIYSPEDRKFYNSVIVLMRDDLDIYHKYHLVPFGEYLPLDNWLRPVLDSMGIPMSDFSPGDNRPLVRAGDITVGVSICYEDVFGEEVIRALPEAGLLVNVSNDAWFGDSLAPHQHLQMAQMRAKETGRYLLRSTNTGISAIIDQKGRIVSRSPQFQPHALTGHVRVFHGSTPYSLMGNYPVIILLAMILAILIGGHYRSNVQALRS